MCNSDIPGMPSIQIKASGVEELIKGLQIHNAIGTDGVLTRLLKELATELTPVFTIIFIASI
jgi:hypothetical protein